MPGGVTKQLATSQVMDIYRQWGYQFLFTVPELKKDVSSTVDQLVENKVTYNWGHILELLARGILNDIHGKLIPWKALKINPNSMICSEEAAYVLQQAGVESPLDPRLKATTPEAFVNKTTGATPIGTYKYGKASSIPLPTPNDSTDYSPEALQKMGEISFKELKDLMKEENLPAVFLCDWALNKYPVDALIHAVTKSWANHVAILYHSDDGNFYLTQSEMENTAQQVAAIKAIFKQLPGRLAGLAKEYNVSSQLKEEGVRNAIRGFIQSVNHNQLKQNELMQSVNQGMGIIEMPFDDEVGGYVVINIADAPCNAKATQTDAQAKYQTKATQTDLDKTHAVKLPAQLDPSASAASPCFRSLMKVTAVATVLVAATFFGKDALSLDEDGSMIPLGLLLIAVGAGAGCYLTQMLSPAASSSCGIMPDVVPAVLVDDKSAKVPLDNVGVTAAVSTKFRVS